MKQPILLDSNSDSTNIAYTRIMSGDRTTVKLAAGARPPLYTCQILNLYYKINRNSILCYFEMFLPEYGAHRHNIRNDFIRLPAIKCEFGEMNAKYQMQVRLRDLASPANPPKYPSIHINEDTLSTSMHRFSSYLQMTFVNSYPNMCNLDGCFVCLNLS